MGTTIQPTGQRPSWIRRKIIQPAKKGLNKGLDLIGGAIFPNLDAFLYPNFVLIKGPNSEGPNSLRAHITAMEGEVPGGTTNNKLTESLEELIAVLKKNKHIYKKTKLVEATFSLLRELSTEQQDANLKVAFQLIEMQTSIQSIAAALLNGTDLSQVKDKDVRAIMENKNKLDKFKCDYSDKDQFEYMRNLLFATAINYEVLVMLAVEDLIGLELFRKSDLSRTLELFPEEPDKASIQLEEKSKRALFVTSWVLKYLGYAHEGNKLEDLGFLQLRPQRAAEVEEYLTTNERGGAGRVASLKILEEIESKIDKMLDSKKLQHICKHRPEGKSVASTDRKLKETEAKDKEKTPDFNGMRVILTSNKIEDCYLALGHIREHFRKLSEKAKFGKGDEWKELDGYYDDYINYPKDEKRDYKSIHVYFRNQDGYTVEIQIRTAEMEFDAERGKASHASYKTGEQFAVSSSTLPVAEQAFMAKKGDIINNGVFFVYDKNDQIIKLVTGSHQKCPTLLDFAFAQGIKTGLFAMEGTIDGNRAKINTELESSQKVEVMTKPSEEPLISGRLKIVATPFARAILTAAINGQIDINKPIEENRLIEIGKHEFIGFRGNLKTDLISALKDKFESDPELRFSMERLLNRRGFSSERDFFITLALLRGTDEFFVNMQAFILRNMVMLALKTKGRSAKLELLVPSKQQGIFLKILSFLDKYKIKFQSLELCPLAESESKRPKSSPLPDSKPKKSKEPKPSPLPDDNYSKIELSVIDAESESVTDAKSTLGNLKNEIENLYLGLPTPQPEYGKILSVEARIPPDSQPLEDILNAFFENNANVISCSIPPSLPGKATYYKFRVQFPRGVGKRAAQKNLERAFKEIKGVRKTTIKTA